MNPGGGIPNSFPNIQTQQDPTGSTRVSPNVRQQAQSVAQPQPQNTGARTTIRRNPAMMGAAVKAGEDGRKLVGFLVTYNRTPMGKAFNIYEGRNYIGRDASCDISIPDDNQMSGKHMLIRYLSGNNKFSFKDEMSSNGTYINKELLDEGELQNYDIIRVGSTLFIFIAIPQI
jgi:predicted component of type VI protein secretion system